MLHLQQLKQFLPFNGLDDKYLDEALKHVRVEVHAKGTMLFKRGKPVGARIFLIDGKVDLIDSAYYATQVESGSERAQSALNEESPTRCSALAKSSITVMSIDMEVLDRIVAWSQAVVVENDGLELNDLPPGGFSVEEIHNSSKGDWMSALLQSPLFERIPITQVQELFLRFEDCQVLKGDVVLKEGDGGDYFYVLASGKAHVYNRCESVDVELGPGSHFGEEALLGNTLRNASVKMLTNGVLKRLNNEDFAALLKSPVLQYLETDKLKTLDKPYKLIDVKMPMEYRVRHVPGSVNVPLSRLRAAIPQLGNANIYVVPDDAGSRADIAAHLLCQAGYDAFILRSPKEEVAA